MRFGWVLAMGLALVHPAGAQSLNTSEGVEPVQGDDRVDQGSQAGLQAWLPGFRERALAAGITSRTLDLALANLRYDADIIAKDRNQNEFTKTIWDYLDTAVSVDRVVPGVKALARHADLFARIEAEYGVEKEVVAAIWGLESAYGTFRGKVPTINALATLSYDARRAAFFEGQLVAALKIVQNGDVTQAAMQGSWAGAMGHTQFMPGSWWEFAVDFDGDGKRNIWGLESAYGTFRGRVPTINALATLSYDARRAAFFEGQLIAALKILQNGDVTQAAMQGSWAGAMGHTQFMPGSWWEFAVDFDGDGKRNIWGDDPADALASTANYLRHWGWTKGQPWGLEVILPDGFDYDQTTERVRKPVADWAALGVRPMAGGELPDGGLASVLLPGGARGAAFLIFSNFQVIERYNTADAYVIAVGHLSDRLRGGPPIKAGWPRELRALTLEERKELQTRLTQAGFDAKGVDGRIGPNTIAAVKGWQKANGRVPDGYASLEVLEALR